LSCGKDAAGAWTAWDVLGEGCAAGAELVWQNAGTTANSAGAMPQHKERMLIKRPFLPPLLEDLIWRPKKIQLTEYCLRVNVAAKLSEGQRKFSIAQNYIL